MGRIGLNDLEHYGSNGGGSFFSLKNDKDVAKVRIMLDKADDMENYMFACHEVEINERRRYVNCLRSYNEPVENCPFCAERMKVIPKIYVPLYNIDSDEVQIWERGKKFMATLSSFMSRYSKPSIVAHTLEIERNGKAGDMGTTYQLYETDEDDTKLEDLPEVPEILGGIVMDKSADDMNYFLDEGEFPPEDAEEAPVRRRGMRDDDMNAPEEDGEELPFAKDEEEKPSRRGSREREERTSRRDSNSGRRTPASNKGSSGGRGRRSF